jgi:hypothetical protein
MKFYIEYSSSYYWKKICNNELSCIYLDYDYHIRFYKNGKIHNNKNAAYTNPNNYKSFYLNGKFYGNKYNFTKKSWRKFVKMQTFL